MSSLLAHSMFVTIIGHRMLRKLWGKRLVLREDGTLTKETEGGLSDGVARRVPFNTMAEFSIIRDFLSVNEAMVGGEYATELPDSVPVGTAHNIPQGGIYRGNDHLRWSNAPGILLIDSDGGPADPTTPGIEAGAPGSREELAEMLEQVAPGITTGPSILDESGSCGVRAGNTPMTGYDRFHFFSLVANASDIPRAMEAMEVRLFLRGHRWALISSAGKVLPRTPVDMSLAMPNQSRFGMAALGEGLPIYKGRSEGRGRVAIRY